MPDLLLWHAGQRAAKLSEVKGPRDRLSDQQRAWMAALAGGLRSHAVWFGLAEACRLLRCAWHPRTASHAPRPISPTRRRMHAPPLPSLPHRRCNFTAEAGLQAEVLKVVEPEVAAKAAGGGRKRKKR